MFKLFFFLFSTFLCILATNLFAEVLEWETLNESPEMTILYAPKSIECYSDGITKVWGKIIYKDIYYKTHKAVENIKTGHQIFRDSYNCKAIKMKTDTLAVYDMRGEGIASEDLSYTNYKTIIPGSIGDMMFDIVCNRCKQ